MMFKPMLAPLDDPLRNLEYFTKLKYPLLVSPKLDGIRCVTRNADITEYDSDFEERVVGQTRICLSRELKPLPSKQVQEAFSRLSWLDGELLVGDETAPNVYNRTQSHVMSAEKPHPDLRYRVFDTCDDECQYMAFEDRLGYAGCLVSKYLETHPLPEGCSISMVEHKLCSNYEELIHLEGLYLTMGYEGVMMRSPSGYYKYNRGTFNEGLIYKLKRFQDDEGIIVDFEEGMRNENAATTNEKGYTVRSESRENMVPADTLGAFIVSWQGKELRVAPGNFTHSERKDIWIRRETLRGTWLKFRFFAYGVKELPRFPRAVGFRDKIDMESK